MLTTLWVEAQGQQVAQAAQATRALSRQLARPFDALRWAYDGAVRAGMAPRSILASRDFERAVGAMERIALGPLARRV